MHIVVEGTAAPVEGGPSLDRVAEAYRSKYDWPVTVVEEVLRRPMRPRVLGLPRTSRTG